MKSKMHAEFYHPSMKQAWNDFVSKSRNATFLFHRDFMEYHQARFTDCSLIFLNDHSQIIGVFPANYVASNNTVVSHGGLTYGGLLLDKKSTLKEVGDMLRLMAEKYQTLPSTHLIYKPTPFIYHQYPSGEAEYWLYRANASLIARSAAQVIDLSTPLPFSELRKRKVKKAIHKDFFIVKGSETELADYWQILTAVLQDHHGVSPVHTLEEMRLLMHRFPQNIQFYAVKSIATQRPVAGTILFDHPPVRHVQYIAASEEGKTYGALDLLFAHLIEQSLHSHFRYIDFGISTEDAGNILNEGLAFQKEGLGGRTINYDAYSVRISDLQTM